MIWFIYAFGLLGFIFKMQGFGQIYDKDAPPPSQNQQTTDWKLFFTLSQFFLDEGPELVLQFFYIENYEVRQTSEYILYKDIAYIIVCIYKCVNCFSDTITAMKENIHSLQAVVHKMLSLWLFTIASVLRATAHFAQGLRYTFRAG